MSELGAFRNPTSAAGLRIWRAGQDFAARKMAAQVEKQRLAEAALQAERERRRRMMVERVERVFGLVQGMNLTRILEEVCKQRNQPMLEVLSDRRSVRLVQARHEIWWRCARETRLSIAEIGRRFKRDHTTIMNGVARHTARIGKVAR